jgi:hypothetical protein
MNDIHSDHIFFGIVILGSDSGNRQEPCRTRKVSHRIMGLHAWWRAGEFSLLEISRDVGLPSTIEDLYGLGTQQKEQAIHVVRSFY